MTVELAQPVRLIPVHTKGRPPSYFIIAGLVFGQVRALLDVAGTDAGPAVLMYTRLICHAAFCLRLLCSKSVRRACQLPAPMLARCLTWRVSCSVHGVLPLCLQSFLAFYVLY